MAGKFLAIFFFFFFLNRRAIAILPWLLTFASTNKVRTLVDFGRLHAGADENCLLSTNAFGNQY